MSSITNPALRSASGQAPSASVPPPGPGVVEGQAVRQQGGQPPQVPPGNGSGPAHVDFSSWRGAVDTLVSQVAVQQTVVSKKDYPHNQLGHLPFLDHTKVGKTAINPSIASDIANPRPAQRWQQAADGTWEKTRSTTRSNTVQKSQIPDLQMQKNAKEGRLAWLERDPASSPAAKQTLRAEIAGLTEKIADLSTAGGSRQKGQELLRKQAIDPLTTESLRGQLELKKESFRTLSPDTPGSDRLRLAAEIQELEARIDSHGHETTWERVKDSHINQTGSATKLSMVMALDARQAAFKQTAREVAGEMGVRICFPDDRTPPSGEYLKVGIVGSTELSSDIDVNITAIGLPMGRETEFVAKFNARSKETQGDQMGNKFDINLYNSMNGKFPDVNAEIKAANGGSTPLRLDLIADPAARRVDDRNEAVVSYLHMARFMSGDQFASYSRVHGEVLGESGRSPESQADLASQLKEGADLEKISAGKVKDKAESLQQSDDPTIAQKTHKEIELIASNILYEEASAAAHQQTDRARTDSERVDANFAMTKAHYFANEAALTRGVLRATVGKEQIIPGINKKRTEQGLPAVGMLDVSAGEYASAARENVGNVFKEINHHGDEPAPMQLVRASKYFGRANRNYQDLAAQQGISLDSRGQAAMDFLQKLSRAEAYSGENQDKGLLALRKDKFSAEKREGLDETNEQAKLRHAKDIMEREGLGAYIDDAEALHAKIIESYAVLDARLSPAAA